MDDVSYRVTNKIKTCNCKCTGFVDKSQVKRKRPNPSMPTNKCQRQIYTQTKSGNAKAKQSVIKLKAMTDFTSYLIAEVWDDRPRYSCTNLTDDCSKVTRRMRKTRKQICHIKEEHWSKMISYPNEKGTILSIFAYFIIHLS